MNKCLLLVMVCAATAIAQAPANPTAIENNKPGNPLSTDFTWGAVANAVWNLGRENQ